MGQKNEFEKKINATKQTSKNSKSPRTVQNQLNFLHQKNCGLISNFQRENKILKIPQKNLTLAITPTTGLA